MEEKSIKIKYEGQEYWFQQNKDGSGPVSYLSHCFENGELNPLTMFSSETFAHVYEDRTMMRFGVSLGRVDEYILK